MNEKKSPGEHAIEYNISGLSSGVYFYQLKTAEHVETKKMLVIR